MYCKNYDIIKTVDCKKYDIIKSEIAFILLFWITTGKEPSFYCLGLFLITWHTYITPYITRREEKNNYANLKTTWRLSKQLFGKHTIRDDNRLDSDRILEHSNSITWRIQKSDLNMIQWTGGNLRVGSESDQIGAEFN